MSENILKLIPIYRGDLLEKYGIPFTVKTLRLWHAIGRNKELFVKLDRRIFLKYDEWEKFVGRNYKAGIEKLSVDEQVAKIMDGIR